MQANETTETLHGDNGRAIITDEEDREKLMHLRRQMANLLKLAHPILDQIEDLLELPPDKRIKFD